MLPFRPHFLRSFKTDSIGPWIGMQNDRRCFNPRYPHITYYNYASGVSWSSPSWRAYIGMCPQDISRQTIRRSIPDSRCWHKLYWAINKSGWPTDRCVINNTCHISVSTYVMYHPFKAKRIRSRSTQQFSTVHLRTLGTAKCLSVNSQARQNDKIMSRGECLHDLYVECSSVRCHSLEDDGCLVSGARLVRFAVWLAPIPLYT